MDVDLPFTALADPRRRSIYELLHGAPASVRELTDQLPISQPAVSQHLKVLSAAGLVNSTPQGAKRIYTTDPAGLAQLRIWIDSMWEDVLDQFDQAARKENER
jgi:DNA-binding transcriptional ArsR family regulator